MQTMEKGAKEIADKI